MRKLSINIQGVAATVSQMHEEFKQIVNYVCFQWLHQSFWLILSRFEHVKNWDDAIAYVFFIVLVVHCCPPQEQAVGMNYESKWPALLDQIVSSTKTGMFLLFVFLVFLYVAYVRSELI